MIKKILGAIGAALATVAILAVFALYGAAVNGNVIAGQILAAIILTPICAGLFYFLYKCITVKGWAAWYFDEEAFFNSPAPKLNNIT